MIRYLSEWVCVSVSLRSRCGIFAQKTSFHDICNIRYVCYQVDIIKVYVLSGRLWQAGGSRYAIMSQVTESVCLSKSSMHDEWCGIFHVFEDV